MSRVESPHRNLDVLFFSRGRGRGHAVPDVAIVDELYGLDPSLRIEFASYSTGLETLRMLGQEATDLSLPDANPFLETMLRGMRLIADRKPKLIVSHEEFSILPAAKALNIPAIFLTDWFPYQDRYRMECLQLATELIFLDEEGFVDQPASLIGRISHVGPVLRSFHLSGNERATLRLELGFSQDDRVVLVIPGSAGPSSEEEAPIVNLVLGAVAMLPGPGKNRVLWINSTGQDSRLAHQLRDKGLVTVLSPRADIEKVMVAADVAITKANRITTLELNALGIPSVSLSYGLNPVDDSRIARVTTNCALRARGLTPSVLSCRLNEAMSLRSEPARSQTGGRTVAESILRHLRAQTGVALSL